MREPAADQRGESSSAFGNGHGPIENGRNGHDGRLRQVELDVREVKTEQRHLASKGDLHAVKEDLHEVETRLNQTLSDIKASLAALTERTTAIERHYATKWFILVSLIAVGGLIVAAVKLLPGTQ